MANVRGGTRADDALTRIAQRIGARAKLRVGFLEGSTEPDGTPTPYVAAINEFGARIEREPREQTIYRLVNEKTGAFLRKGRFVKRRKSNFATTHYVGAHIINIPPRPFFRNMIAKHKGEWGNDVAKIAKRDDYNAIVILAKMGERIKGQLQRSIRETNTPPNAPSTIARKGFNKPLIDTGTMWRSVDYQVVLAEEGGK